MKDSSRTPRIAILGVTQRGNTMSFGGAPVVAVNLANHFVHRGFPVEVLIFTRPGITAFPFPFDAAVTIRRLTARSTAMQLIELVSGLLRARPGHLIAIGNKANALAAMAVAIPGVRSALWATLHHSLASEIAGWSDARRRRRLRRWGRINARAAGVIAVSAGLADEFRRLTSVSMASLHVIHNPVVDAALEQRMTMAASHPWLDDDAAPLLLGVGRLTEQKDFATLIRAFAQVHSRRPSRLLIIGEGEQRDSLSDLARELGVSACVDLAGFKPNPLPFMRKARLLVSSSRWEGFGNVLVEALCCGTPVVSTDCPHGPRELLADGRFGRLVPVGDATALADAILDALNNRPCTRDLQERGRHFSIEASGDRYLQVMGLTD
jgi:glycosyltransferase involved in cell wall biosynthesis